MWMKHFLPRSQQAVSQKKKATVNQIPNAAVSLVVTFALLPNRGMSSEWPLCRNVLGFFSTEDKSLVQPKSRSSLCEIWPLDAEVMPYLLVTCGIPLPPHLNRKKVRSATLRQYALWLSILGKFSCWCCCFVVWHLLASQPAGQRSVWGG